MVLCGGSNAHRAFYKKKNTKERKKKRRKQIEPNRLIVRRFGGCSTDINSLRTNENICNGSAATMSVFFKQIVDRRRLFSAVSILFLNHKVM